MDTAPFHRRFASLAATLTAACLTLSANAQSTDVAALSAQFETVQAKLGAASKQRLDALAQSYAAELGRIGEAAKAKGDLDLVQVAQREREWVTAGGDSDSKPPVGDEPLVAAAREKFDRARIAEQAAIAGQRMKPTQRFIELLKEAETALTKNGELDQALATREQRVALETQLGSLAARASQRAPAPFAPTPPAPREPSTDERLVKVADSLAAKSGTKGAVENVINFDAPRGDGRSGAKGLIYRPEIDPESDPEGGSTWQFVYRRGGHARTMQIIHPHRDGQLIVHVSKSNAGLSSPSAWSRSSWGGGSGERLRRKREADEVFKLEDGKDFRIFSRLEPNGSYSLYINETLVITGRASRTSALDMASFETGKEHEDLEEWSPGWAGLIVGPIDKGENVCSEIKFAAAAVPAPGE